jgi:curli biogenesis system outer membrane secretion channel CsgG
MAKGEFTTMKRMSSVAVWLGVAFTVLTASLAVATPSKQRRPSIAVLEFQNKAGGTNWNRGNAQAAQDVFVTELVGSRKFQVVEREQLQALMKEKNLTLSGDVDPSTAAKMGQSLGVKYLLTGAVTEYGVTGKGVPGGAARKGRRAGARARGGPFTAAMTASLIDTSTGEIVWSHAARRQVNVSVGGFGGGVEDQRIFNRVAKPTVRQLTASLKAAKL